MFGKLLKYDMRAIGRSFWIIAISMLGLSGLGGVCLRFILECAFADQSELPEIYPLFAVISMLGLVFCFAALILSMVVTEVLLLMRFYKNFFTDEGYLTFTLPVTRRQLLFSKFLNACIWMAIHVLLLIVCLVIFFSIAFIGLEYSGEIVPLIEGFKLAFAQLGDVFKGWWIVYAVELVLIALCSLVYAVSTMYFCFTLGGVHAKKNKVLASIGIWYLSSMVASAIFSLLTIFGTAAIEVGLTPMLKVATTDTAAAVIALLFALVGVGMVTLAVILYNITLGKLERRLNLA